VTGDSVASRGHPHRQFRQGFEEHGGNCYGESGFMAKAVSP